VPFLGRIPIDPEIVQSSDDGHSYIYEHADAPAAKAMQAIVAQIIEKTIR